MSKYKNRHENEQKCGNKLKTFLYVLINYQHLLFSAFMCVLYYLFQHLIF